MPIMFGLATIRRDGWVDESDGLENRCASHSRHWMARSYERSPSFEGLFLFQRPPIGKPPGAGYLEGMGIGSRSVKVLTLGHRVLLRQHRT